MTSVLLAWKEKKEQFKRNWLLSQWVFNLLSFKHKDIPPSDWNIAWCENAP